MSQMSHFIYEIGQAELMEKKNFNSIDELDNYVKQYPTIDVAMIDAGYKSGRKQYSRFKKKFTEKPPAKAEKNSQPRTIARSRKSQKKLLQIDWNEMVAYIVQIKVDQQMKDGMVEDELQRLIDNVFVNKKQYRVVKDYHNLINGYLREKGAKI